MTHAAPAATPEPATSPAAGPAHDLAPPPAASAPGPRLIAVMLFMSGMCALLYQTAWQRSFLLVFGATSAASSAVLGVFLGGLGAGAWFFGRRLERRTHPLSDYGNLELGIALSAAASPLLLDALAAAYLASGGSPALGNALSTLLRLGIATLVMGVPAFLMGGTLPAAARAAESDGDRARTRLALLYGANTLGAVLGALLGTFVMFELFGTRQTSWIAALVNLLVAIAARSRGRSAPEVPAGEALAPTLEALETSAPAGSMGPVSSTRQNGAAGAPGSGPRSRNADAARWQNRAALATGASAGFAFLLLELVWYRMLAPLLGGSTFTFGLILAVALGGIGLGGYLYSRRPEGEPVTLLGVATITAALALCVALPYALGDTLAVYAALTRDIGSLGFGWLSLAWVSVAAAVVLPAATLSGYQFPSLLSLLGSGRQRVATDVGSLYAVNTLGSIAGALVGGFVLLPSLGATAAWQLCAAVYALTALGVLVLAVSSEGARRPARLATIVSLAAAALWCAGARGPTAAFRHTPIGAGRAGVHGMDTNALSAWRQQQNDELVWERDGVEAAVAVMTGDGFRFVVNGKVDGSVFWDRGTQGMLGLLPALLHEAPRSAFVVGLGTGMSAGWLGRVPQMQVDVAELEPVIDRVAHMSAAMNQDVMNQPNVQVHHADGRELLLTSDRRYDLIISEPSNPYRSGVASLFTREFYQAAHARLNPGGIFGQWLQGYEIDARSIRIVARTLKSVFAHVELWQTEGSDLLFLASDSERTISVDALRAELELEPYRSAIRRFWLVQDAEGVIAHFVAGDAIVSEMANHLEPELNEDDRNVLEYAFARRVGISTTPPVPILLAHARALGESRPRLTGQLDAARTDELAPRTWLIGGAGDTRAVLPPEAKARLDAVAAACSGVPELSLQFWRAQPRREPRDDMERFAVALGHARLGLASPHIAELEALGYPAEAALTRAWLATHAGDRAAAVGEYTRGLEALRAGEIPLCRTAVDLVVGLRDVALPVPELRRRAFEALERPLLVELAESERRIGLERLAFASMHRPDADPEQCVRALGSRVREPRWEQSHLEGRYACLQLAGHALAGQAEEDLVQFLAAGTGELVPDVPDATPLPRPPHSGAAP